MSNPEDIPVPNPTGWPRFTQRLFSYEVGIALADTENPLAKDPGYEFSNGRRFDDTPKPSS